MESDMPGRGAHGDNEGDVPRLVVEKRSTSCSSTVHLPIESHRKDAERRDKATAARNTAHTECMVNKTDHDTDSDADLSQIPLPQNVVVDKSRYSGTEGDVKPMADVPTSESPRIEDRVHKKYREEGFARSLPKEHDKTGRSEGHSALDEARFTEALQRKLEKEEQLPISHPGSLTSPTRSSQRGSAKEGPHSKSIARRQTTEREVEQVFMEQKASNEGAASCCVRLAEAQIGKNAEEKLSPMQAKLLPGLKAYWQRREASKVAKEEERREALKVAREEKRRIAVEAKAAKEKERRIAAEAKAAEEEQRRIAAAAKAEDERIAWRQRRDEELKGEQTVKANAKPCPKCSWYVQKKSGCEHVSRIYVYFPSSPLGYYAECNDR